MARHAAHPPPRPYVITPFLDDARRNLALLRQTYGAHSQRYRALLAHYRIVADDLGCRPALEDVLRSLCKHRGPPEPESN